MFKFNKLLGNKKLGSKILRKDPVEVFPTEQIAQNSTNQSDDIPIISKGKIVLQFTSASPTEGGLLVGFFIANGLDHKINCKNLSLVLIDSSKRVLARQSFDGDIIGKIDSNSEKACVARFLLENVFSDKIPSHCELRFDPSSITKTIFRSYKRKRRSLLV